MKNRRRKSLSLLVAQQTALVIAAAMAVYALFQYFMTPERTVSGLALEHGWHVAVLGCLTYLVLYLALRRKVVRPIENLYVKLYGIANGDIQPVSVDSNISEIQHIAEGVNLMLSKMTKANGNVSLPELSSNAEELRALAKRGERLDESERMKMMDLASKIDQIVSALSAESVRKGGG